MTPRPARSDDFHLLGPGLALIDLPPSEERNIRRAVLRAETRKSRTPTHTDARKLPSRTTNGTTAALNGGGICGNGGKSLLMAAFYEG